MNLSIEKLKNSYLDFISGIVLLVFSILVFIYGIYIVNTMNLGKGVEWYSSPALMPLFIGAVITILSLLLIIKSKDSYIEFKECKASIVFDDKCKLSIKELLLHYKDNQILRFIITLMLLITYVFFLIGRIPFVLATFLYLSLNMIAFRENGFAYWKILIISIVMSLLINYGFGIVAKIPLP